MRLGLLKKPFPESVGTTLATTQGLKLLCYSSKKWLLLSVCPTGGPGEKGMVVSLLTPPIIEPGHLQGRADAVLQWQGNAPCDGQKGHVQFLSGTQAHGYTRVNNDGVLPTVIAQAQPTRSIIGQGASPAQAAPC